MITMKHEFIDYEKIKTTKTWKLNLAAALLAPFEIVVFLGAYSEAADEEINRRKIQEKKSCRK